MHTTLDLADEAIAKTGLSERALCRQLGVAPTNISMARRRGNMSPLLAGQLAETLGQNVEHWMAIAVLESTPKSRTSERLARAIGWKAEQRKIPGF